MSNYRARNFSARDSFLRYAGAALKAQGYEVNVFGAVRPTHEFLKAYPSQTEAPGDAYLDVLMTDRKSVV